MKSFADYWRAMSVRNPLLEDPDATVTITAANFKRALEQAYAEGSKRRGTGSDPFEEIFSTLKR